MGLSDIMKYKPDMRMSIINSIVDAENAAWEELRMDKEIARIAVDSKKAQRDFAAACRKVEKLEKQLKSQEKKNAKQEKKEEKKEAQQQVLPTKRRGRSSNETDEVLAQVSKKRKYVQKTPTKKTKGLCLFCCFLSNSFLQVLLALLMKRNPKKTLSQQVCWQT